MSILPYLGTPRGFKDVGDGIVLYDLIPAGPSGAGAFVPVQFFGAKSDGVTDDSAAFQAGLAATAGTGTWLWVPRTALPYIIAHPISVPSFSQIWGSSGAVLKSTMAPSGADPTNCIFIASQVSGADTTFAANNVVGASTISSVGTFAVGDVIQLKATATYNNLRSGVYTVIGVAGAGPHTLTLDRPVLFQFQAGDTITKLVSRPQGIQIIGNGMTLGGTGDRYIELAAAANCVLATLNFDGRNYGGAPATYAFSFDVASYNCHALRCSYDGGGTGANGFAMESAESCLCIDLIARHVTSVGIQVLDCVIPALVNCIASNCGSYGLELSGEFATAGTNNARVQGGTFQSCAVGIQIDSASARNIIEGAICTDNTSHGVEIQTASDTVLLAVTAQRNAATGIIANVGSTGTKLSNCDVSSNTLVGVNLQTSAEISNLTALACGTQALYVAGAGTSYISGLQAQSNSAAWQAIETNNAGALIYVSDVHVTMDGANGFALLNAAGSIYASGMLVDGAGAGSTGVYGAAGTTTTVDETVDVTACTTQFNSNGGAILGALLLTGQVAAAGGTWTHDFFVPNGQSFSMRAQSVWRDGAAAKTANLVAKCSAKSVGGASSLPAAIAGSANPQNSANLIASEAIVSEFVDGVGAPSTAVWSAVGASQNIRLTLTNTDAGGSVANHRTVVTIESH